MVAHAPGTPDTLLACRSWLDEEDAALRVEAACGAGRSGADALLAFLQDPSSEPGHVTRALAAWSALDPVPGDPEAILRPLLGDDGGSGIRRAAVRAAGRVRCAAVLSLVACSAETDAGDALEVVTALTRLAAAGTEPALVRLLASPFETVRLAALRALAATGTLASVPALLPLSSGVLGSAQVREAATDAVRAIRARLGPVESGRVSLAADAAAEGALSLGGDGALSLARAEPGALSRAPGDVPGPADMADDRARVQHPGDT
jgi:HEAT repeat protein